MSNESDTMKVIPLHFHRKYEECLTWILSFENWSSIEAIALWQKIKEFFLKKVVCVFAWKTLCQIMNIFYKQKLSYVYSVNLIAM